MVAGRSILAGAGETVVDNKKLLSPSAVRKIQHEINPLTNEQNKKTRTINKNKLINAIFFIVFNIFYE